MKEDPRTNSSLATPLGRLVDSRTPKKHKPMIPLGRLANARSKGRLNLKAVAEVLAERGLDPTVELVNIITSGELDPDLKAKYWATLLEYTQPKKKSVEITGAEGGAIQIENVPDNVLVQIALAGITTALEEDDEPEQLPASPFRESFYDPPAK